jgi:hypothetical protein
LLPGLAADARGHVLNHDEPPFQGLRVGDEAFFEGLFPFVRFQVISDVSNWHPTPPDPARRP